MFVAELTSVVIIWLDSGTDYDSESPVDSIRIGSSRLLPVIRQKSMLALKTYLYSWPDSESDELGQKPSISSLYDDYGRLLRESIMATDAFYALNDVFSFVAASESQFLNLVDDKIYQYKSSALQDLEKLANLSYTRDILYRHIRSLQDALASFENITTNWPRANDDAARKAQNANNAIKQDFSHLLNLAHVLNKRCNEEITNIMSILSISESQQGIHLAKRLGRLTFLAFFFVPLSFTTSFFGMNVKELSDNKLSIYWWVVFSVVVCFVAVSAYFINLKRRFIQLQRFMFKQ